MDLIITPEPHLIPGYTGHCPQYRFCIGETYGRTSHKTLINPCVYHSPELIVSHASKTRPQNKEQHEIEILNARKKHIDVVYDYPIIPNYDSFIPNQEQFIGKRFHASAVAGVAQHQTLMDLLHCKHHNLVHTDSLLSGKGRFDPKFNERLMATAKYQSPLFPVQKQSRAFAIEECSTVKRTHAKSAKRFIVNGYGGHIPMSRMRFGQCNKQLTSNALAEYDKNYYKRLNAKWCPISTKTQDSQCNVGADIYLQHAGLMPNYGGHVPGKLFKFGLTYGNATLNSKNWFSLNKTN